jgi:hypothetical protein
MFIKKHFIVLYVIATVLLLAVVAFKIKYDTVRHFHGVCNDGVGQPYQDFIHQLRGLSESGNTKELSRVLAAADTNSLDIYSVWLYDDVDAYRASIQKILK